jgi:putative ABC transport system permease protein
VGATRAHIVRQLMTESGLLALGGLLLAAILTWWGIRLVEAYLPPSLEGYVTRPQVSWRVGLFAVAATLLCLVLVGLAPAIRLSRVDIEQVLKSGTGTGQSRCARRQYGFLVVAEVAMALALLTSTSLLLKAVWQVRSFDYGHDVNGLLQGFVGLRGDPPADVRTRRDWSDRIVQRALSVPGVRGAATVVNRAPPRRAISVDAPGGAPRIFTTHTFGYQEVSPDYFSVTSIPVVRGRGFTPGEYAEPVVVIEERAANLFWPGLDPVGRMIKLDSAHTSEPWLRVVGVVKRVQRWFPRNMDDFEMSNRMSRSVGTIYVLSADRPIAARSGAAGATVSTYASLVVRTDSAPQAVAVELRRALLALAPNALVDHPRTWEQMTGLASLRARQEFMAALFVVFAFCALALAVLGVYAIMAHAVAQRTREFGLRLAIGASQQDIRSMVLREGNVLALLGIAIGLVLTWKNAALLRAFLFSDYDRYDSRFFAAAAVLLFATSLLASYVPARRAMRIDPVQALRSE